MDTSVALIMAVSRVNPGLNVPGTWQGLPLCLSHEGAKGCVTWGGGGKHWGEVKRVRGEDGQGAEGPCSLPE